MTSAVPLPDDLRRLLPRRLVVLLEPVDLCKGERLFLRRRRPRNLYFVTRGEIVLERIDEHGSSVMLQRVRRGCVAEASLQSGSYHCDALVTVAGHAVALPIDPLKAELAQDSAFAMRWIGMLNTEVRRLRAQCERLSLDGVGERLLHLIDTEGTDGRLAIASGLKSLATELAVTHEALYRTVAALERTGVVYRESGCISLRRT